MSVPVRTPKSLKSNWKRCEECRGDGHVQRAVNGVATKFICEVCDGKGLVRK